MHGAPPSVIHLRSRAIVYCLTSFTSLIAQCHNTQISDIWYAASEYLEPMLHEAQGGEAGVAQAWAGFLMAMEASHYDQDIPSHATEDPFKITVSAARPVDQMEIYRNAIARYMTKGDVWRDAMITASSKQVRQFHSCIVTHEAEGLKGRSGDLVQVLGLAESLLSVRSLYPLGEACVEAIYAVSGIGSSFPHYIPS